MASSHDSPKPTTITFPGHEIPPERLALQKAAGSGDIAEVERLLSQLSSSTQLPQTPAQYLANARLTAAKKGLQEASKAGNLEDLDKLLQDWKNESSIPDPESEDLDLPLIEAARHGCARIVSRLLDEGAVLGPHIPITALKTGSQAVSLFQVFMDHGWDVNFFNGTPVLQTVVENEELTTLLLDHGADPNQVSSRGMYAIECAASLGTVSVVKLLLERGASLSKCNSLHHAVCTRNSDENCFTMMEFLLQKGVDINERSWKVQQKIPSRTIGGTALMSAVKKQEAATEEMDMARRVKWLLAHGADPDIVDAGGKKPVDYAKEKELIEILQSSTKV